MVQNMTYMYTIVPPLRVVDIHCHICTEVVVPDHFLLPTLTYFLPVDSDCTITRITFTVSSTNPVPNRDAYDIQRTGVVSIICTLCSDR